MVSDEWVQIIRKHNHNLKVKNKSKMDVDSSGLKDEGGRPAKVPKPPKGRGRLES